MIKSSWELWRKKSENNHLEEIVFLSKLLQKKLAKKPEIPDSSPEENFSKRFWTHMQINIFEIT